MAFVKMQILERGHRPVVMDVGVLGDPVFAPEISRRQVASAAGVDVDQLVAEGDRGRAIAAMSKGAVSVVRRLSSENQIDAVLGLGGGTGTTIATAAMRTLPIGLPKVMFSTMAGGDVRDFVGLKDIVMFPTIVDVCGLNRISLKLLAQVSGAVCGMVESKPPRSQAKPLLGISMFGNTTSCVERAKEILERARYEILVFHSNGIGGRTMEDLIQSGLMAGVLDITTTELADELVGGVLSAGSKRLEAGAHSGIPVVIAPGCLDMVNFWAPDSVPERFRGRLLYPHNPNVTLMRTTPEENNALGSILAEKINASIGPVEVFLPLRGVSALSAPGSPFHCPEADAALFESIKGHLHSTIPVREIDTNINDPEFAAAAAEGMLRMLKAIHYSSDASTLGGRNPRPASTR